MFVFACSVLSFLGAFIGTKIAGDFGLIVGLIGGAFLGWYVLGNLLGVDDW